MDGTQAPDPWDVAHEARQMERVQLEGLEDAVARVRTDLVRAQDRAGSRPAAVELRALARRTREIHHELLRDLERLAPD